MSERYWITGCQLGLMAESEKEKRKALLDKIVDEQFITNCWTDEDKQAFKNLMNELVDTEMLHWKGVKSK